MSNEKEGDLNEAFLIQSLNINHRAANPAGRTTMHRRRIISERIFPPRLQVLIRQSYLLDYLTFRLGW